MDIGRETTSCSFSEEIHKIKYIVAQPKIVYIVPMLVKRDYSRKNESLSVGKTRAYPIAYLILWRYSTVLQMTHAGLVQSDFLIPGRCVSFSNQYKTQR